MNCPICNKKMRHSKKFDAYYCKSCKKCYNHDLRPKAFVPLELEKPIFKFSGLHFILVIFFIFLDFFFL